MREPMIRVPNCVFCETDDVVLINLLNEEEPDGSFALFADCPKCGASLCISWLVGEGGEDDGLEDDLEREAE